VNGKPIKGSRELAREVGMLAPGTSVKFNVLHQGTSKTVDLTLGEMPREQQANASEQQKPAQNEPHLGLALAPANEVTGAGNEGVAVVGVEPSSPAADRGFKTGDVILQVGGKSVSNVKDVRNALDEAHAGGKRDVLMRVKSADGVHFVAMPIAKG
jgi:serine protease Do